MDAVMTYIQEMPAIASVARRPALAVDLDGTLVVSDTLHEGCAAYLKSNPGEWLSLLPALLQGKAGFKRHISNVVAIDPAHLRYNEEFLEYLRSEHLAGRRLGLFTAADQSIADAVAAHLGLFDVVRGSNGSINLSGRTKLAVIEAEFGASFVYAGDSAVDQPIFARAAAVVLVGPVAQLQSHLPPETEIEARFPMPSPTAATWARALRLRHWSKNLLVFVSAALAPPDWEVLLQTCALFVLLGLLASATYLINDLLDLQADRQHIVKRFRPLASAELSIRSAALVACAMIVGSLAAGWSLSSDIGAVLIAYLGITLCYSLVLKRLPMVDITVLAGLFTLRVLAGAVLTPAPLSPWLLTFSMLFFFSLASTKRYTELGRQVREEGELATARGYTYRDLPILLAAGIGSAMSALVICMIYLISDQYARAVYTHPQMVWGIMPLLLVWLLRIWHLTVHGRLSEDPVMFAVTDRTSQMLGIAVASILLISRL